MKFKNYLFDLYPYFPKGFSLDNREDPDVCSKALYDDLCKMFFDDDSKEKLKITSVCNKCQNYGNRDYYTLFIDKDKYLLSSIIYMKYIYIYIIEPIVRTFYSLSQFPTNFVIYW